MGIKQSFRTWRKSRSIHNELSQFSERALRDMGIDPSDISRIARETARHQN